MAVIRIAAILKPSKMADIWRLFGWLAPFPSLARNRTMVLSLTNMATNFMCASRTSGRVPHRATLTPLLLKYKRKLTCIPVDEVYLIPELNPEYIVLLVSGATASIGLDKSARITAGEKVLITAAAGGAGHIAVQWAKAAGCYVIGTCSTEEKEKVLKELGCDRVINYKKEDLAEVLRKEYQSGIDVIWETIGGQVFETCIKNIANRGRIVIVGGISSYKSEDSFMPKLDLSFLPELLLFKSAAVLGFRRAAYRECFASYFKFLSESLQKGDLKTIIDNGEKPAGNEFFGMEGIIKGVEHLHTGKSIGKVIARLY
ncbi:Prostaglandin reductase 3 [Araneus ventricosus]|uniref:15-oxoprostaglandin 13-reductase n=1 Tax=Araneus ventricosus TaxID=182803 RepID=A0A4Y2GV96_ARAVE|nr:Prostaglandin reductase 3 [Araneus ventricosus]